MKVFQGLYGAFRGSKFRTEGTLPALHV